jgi:hypothetical protein
MAPARTPRLLLAGCALLAAVACGAPAQPGSTPTATSKPSMVRDALAPAAGALNFGVENTFAGGVAITVSTPKSFQPSPTAYPHCERAAAFEIEVHNGGSEPYRLSGLSVTGSIAGTQAIQVVDSTQGFNGIVDAGKDIYPGRTVRLNLAFAVPPQPAELRLVIRPDTAGPVSATYSGSA